MSGDVKAVLAVLGCSIAIFWPGARTFGFPGVMTPIWQEMFHVGLTHLLKWKKLLKYPENKFHLIPH